MASDEREKLILLLIRAADAFILNARIFESLGYYATCTDFQMLSLELEQEARKLKENKWGLYYDC